MKNISLKQLIILFILTIFFFSDLNNLKKKFNNFLRNILSFLKKNRKKGT